MCEILTTRSRLRKNPMGFTLIEMVVAVSLLTIAIIPILKALTVAYVTSSAIEQKSRSLIYAQSKLDEIRASSIYNYNGTFAANDTSLGNSYFYKVTDTSAGTDLRTITVVVGYDTSGNNNISPDEVRVTLSTLVARRY
jgi:prepilin-type N-terminal cleavage/methylation domain-containing protein